MTSTGTDDHMQYCTFHLGDLFLGVQVTRVQEVIRTQRTTPVPLASPVISGLMNLRGEIVTTIDLRRRLGLPDRAAGQDPMNVVIRAEDGVVSLLVDEIGDVIDALDDAFEPSPSTLRAATRDVIDGVYKLDGRLLLILDCDRVLDLPATLQESA
ncbi:MAG TPA: chemotaxis protein CheW [Acidimicrobiales bacterium]|nr:chemotaxis protein CheW [Acidimicrobiales bacterium]